MNPLAALRSKARRTLDFGQRVLHPYRRRRAERRLARAMAESRGELLFVCHGNICRSPFAEQLLRQQIELPDALDVRSSGFYGDAGRRSPPEAIEAARRRGVELEGHRSSVLTDPAFADLSVSDPIVFVMNAGQRSRLRRREGTDRTPIFVLGDFDPEAIDHRRIEDPWGKEPEEFDRVFGRIERCVRAVADLAGSRPAALA